LPPVIRCVVSASLTGLESSDRRQGKGRTFRAEVLFRAEAYALIGACSPASRTGIRNRAILTVLYRAGCGAFSIRETFGRRPSHALADPLARSGRAPR
jgi:hypothetical protein